MSKRKPTVRHPQSNTLLPDTLACAIPLWQNDLKKLPWSEVDIQLSGTAKLLGSRGDLLLFGGGKKGEVAALFNKVAKSIAIMSFWPGGITLFGQHWEDTHPGAPTTKKETGSCPTTQDQ